MDFYFLGKEMGSGQNTNNELSLKKQKHPDQCRVLELHSQFLVGNRMITGKEKLRLGSYKYQEKQKFYLFNFENSKSIALRIKYN